MISTKKPIKPMQKIHGQREDKLKVELIVELVEEDEGG
jgi:hypothetical protein